MHTTEMAKETVVLCSTTVALSSLKVFDNQVGGTFPILTKGGYLYKPARIREVRFYETVSEVFPELLPFLAEFKGCCPFDAEAFVKTGARFHSDGLKDASGSSVLKTDGDSISIDSGDDFTEEKRIDEEKTHASVDTKIKTEVMSSTPTVAISTPTPAVSSSSWAQQVFVEKKGRLESLIRDTEMSQFAILSDLTVGYSKPCVLDLKLGVRHYPPFVDAHKFYRQMGKAWNSTSRRIGVRLGGMKLWDTASRKYVSFDKVLGKKATCNEFVVILKRFLQPLLATDSGKLQLSRLVSELKIMRAAFQKPCAYRFMSSSVLLIYEGDSDCDSRSQVNAIDFSNIHPLALAKSSEATADSGIRMWLHDEIDSVDLPDAGVCWALHSVTRILEDIIAANIVSLTDEQWSQWSLETCPFSASALIPILEASKKCKLAWDCPPPT